MRNILEKFVNQRNVEDVFVLLIAAVRECNLSQLAELLTIDQAHSNWMNEGASAVL